MDREMLAEPVTLLIQQEVRAEAVDRYERWLERIMPAASRFDGHAGVQVARPPAQGPRRYSVAVRFDSLASAQRWLQSQQRRALMTEAAELLVRDETVTTLAGLTAWFGEPTAPTPPRRWKQFVVSLAAIYPLTLLLPWAVGRVQDLLGLRMPPALQQLFVAASLVALMTWVVMPRATRLLVRWLHR